MTVLTHTHIVDLFPGYVACWYAMTRVSNQHTSEKSQEKRQDKKRKCKKRRGGGDGGDIP